MASKKNKKTKSNQDRKEKAAAGISIRRFLITYLMLIVAFFFFAWFKPIHKIIDVNDVYTQSVVVATSKVLALLGISSASQGSIITLPGLSLDVKFGCNGLEAVMIYSIAVLAYPAHWKKKIVGIAAGFLLLQAANILRIVLLVYSGIHLKNLFEYIHIYIAQGIMIVLSLILFFIYLDHATSSKTAHN
jgi:exosortase H (IPTLxxWG-CTERM-specific)